MLLILLESKIISEDAKGKNSNNHEDKKNSDEEAYFDIPENTEELQVKINKNFRMICTCNINKIIIIVILKIVQIKIAINS